MVVVTDKFEKENGYLQLLIINTTNKIIIKNCVQHSHTCWLAPILPTQKRVGALGPIRVAPKDPWG